MDMVFGAEETEQRGGAEINYDGKERGDYENIDQVVYGDAVYFLLILLADGARDCGG